MSDAALGLHHIALVVREADQERALYVHLAWHLLPLDEEFPERYLMVTPDVPEPTLSMVAGWARKILRENPSGIPYGFSLPDGCFDAESGVFRGAPHRLGLTCATFVLAVFELAGYPLANYESWRPRPEDAVWQAHILSILAKTRNATPQHVEAVRREAVAVRFRPSEVGGAARLSDHPAEFEQVEPVAAQIAALIV
ncbi:MAG: hypothetical protein ACREJO_04800 [Phycisphaerales bacterium]